MKYKLQSPIMSLDASPERDRVVVAGKEILCILRVGYSEFTEVDTLRIQGEAKRFSQSNVKWGCCGTERYIATACTNGTIFIYDTKEGLKLVRTFKEHARAVHRLAFNFANGNLLLSACQDGSMKLFDLRTNTTAKALTFIGKADAVRDVQFNAQNATEFAAAFDSGFIQVNQSQESHKVASANSTRRGGIGETIPYTSAKSTLTLVLPLQWIGTPTENTAPAEVGTRQSKYGISMEMPVGNPSMLSKPLRLQIT